MLENCSIKNLKDKIDKQFFNNLYYYSTEGL